MLIRFLRSLGGDDVFISYSRADGAPYLRGLDAALSRRGFSCFTDRRGTEAHPLPPETLYGRIRACKTLVLLGTPGALARPEHIAPEVRQFAEANGTARILCVSFDGDAEWADWSNAPWFGHVEGKARERESASALKTGEPSASVVDAIVQASDYMKSKDRLRRSRNVALVVFIALLAGGLAAGLFASSKFREALWLSAIADSRASANRADTLLREQPAELMTSVEHAIVAMEKSVAAGARTVEADAALRNALRMLPLLKSSDTFATRDEARKTAFVPSEIAGSTFSPDGRHVAIISNEDNTLRIYDTAATIERLKPLHEVACDCDTVAISRGARTAAVIVNDSRRLRVLNLEHAGRAPVELSHIAADGVALSPDGRTLAVYRNEGADGDRIGYVQIVDVVTAKTIATIRDLKIKTNSISFGATGNLAVAGASVTPQEGRFPGRVVMWAAPGATNGRPLTESSFGQRLVITQPDEARVIAPGADLSYFATDRGMWRRVPGADEYTLAGLLPAERDFLVVGNDIEGLAFGDDHRLTVLRNITTTQAQAEFDQMALEVWDTSPYEVLSRIAQQTEAEGVSLDEGGNLVAVLSKSADAGNNPRVFRTREGTPMDGFADQPSANPGDTVGAFEANGGIKIHLLGDSVQAWNVWKKRATTLSIGGELREVNSVAIGSGGEFTAFAGNNADDVPLIVVHRQRGDSYNALKTIVLRKDLNETEPPYSISLSADGRRLAALYADGDIVTIRDVEGQRVMTPKSLANVTNIDHMSLSPSGRFFALAHDNARVDIVDLSTWLPPSTLRLLDATRVCSMGFSSNDRYLGLGTCDGLLHVFETGRPDGVGQIARLPHRGTVSAFAFSRDGRYVVAASSDRPASGQARDTSHLLTAWTIDPRDLMGEARRRLAAIKRYRSSRSPT